MDWTAATPIPRAPALADDEVHVWSASLDTPPLTDADLRRVLTAHEAASAGRHASPLDRARNASARGLLRWLLGGYLQVEPSQAHLVLGPDGKPELASTNWQFNVAHSDGLALYAVTRGRAIGVDLEHVRPTPHALAVARRFFAPAEVEALAVLPAGRLDDAFYVYWTRKEAILKASGAGLRALRDPMADEDWTVCDLRPASGLVGAVAVPHGAVRLRCWRWA